MRMEKRSFNPVEYQNHIQARGVDEWLRDAVHVDTHTIDQGKCGGQRTIIIFAFFPNHSDEK